MYVYMYMQDIADSYHVNKLQRKRQTTPFANLCLWAVYDNNPMAQAVHDL